MKKKENSHKITVYYVLRPVLRARRVAAAGVPFLRSRFRTGISADAYSGYGGRIHHGTACRRDNRRYFTGFELFAHRRFYADSYQSAVYDV